MSVQSEILKSGILELYNRSKITSALKTEMDDYIDILSVSNIEEVLYTDFNQNSSVNCTFDDLEREVTWDSDTAVLITNEIELTNVKLKSFKLKGTDENIVWKYSINGSNWYAIDPSYDINEVISDGFYLRVEFTSTNTINGIIITYENL